MTTEAVDGGCSHKPGMPGARERPSPGAQGPGPGGHLLCPGGHDLGSQHRWNLGVDPPARGETGTLRKEALLGPGIWCTAVLTLPAVLRAVRAPPAGRPANQS